MPLYVKKLDPRATVPTVAHPGEDLAYDLYAIEDVVIAQGVPTKIRTGIAVEHVHAVVTIRGYKHVGDGLLIRDRSSMAAKGVTVSGGVIDAGYRDEVLVLLTAGPTACNAHDMYEPGDNGSKRFGYLIKAGDKIAQMIPVPVLTDEDVLEVVELTNAKRGNKGFGSTGR